MNACNETIQMTIDATRRANHIQGARMRGEPGTAAIDDGAGDGDIRISPAPRIARGVLCVHCENLLSGACDGQLSSDDGDCLCYERPGDRPGQFDDDGFDVLDSHADILRKGEKNVWGENLAKFHPTPLKTVKNIGVFDNLSPHIACGVKNVVLEAISAFQKVSRLDRQIAPADDGSRQIMDNTGHGRPAIVMEADDDFGNQLLDEGTGRRHGLAKTEDNGEVLAIRRTTEGTARPAACDASGQSCTGDNGAADDRRATGAGRWRQAPSVCQADHLGGVR